MGWGHYCLPPCEDITERPLWFQDGYGQMNLNLSRSSEGILSIVHREKTQVRYLTEVKSGQETAISESEIERERIPSIHRRLNKENPLKRGEIRPRGPKPGLA